MKKHLLKIKVLLILIVLACLVMIFNVWLDKNNMAKRVTYGVTFCQGYAKALGFNPHQLYLQMFQDLKIKNIRLSAYWDEIEQNPEQFDFTDLDFYINEAQKNHAQVILAIGYKLPRWPECRVPKWLAGKPIKYRQAEQLKMLSMVIDYYTKISPRSNIQAFQIENEPLLQFGSCDPVDQDFFKQEVAFVRSKTDKPIIITDSGELSSWILPMQLSDFFGTTMYRLVHNPVLGAIPYPLQPWFYRFKAEIIHRFFAPQNLGIINIELQAEPWAYIFVADIPVADQLKYFGLKDFQKNIEFAKKTGFPETYLWGVEWWYWVASKGHPEYLDFAKTLLK